MLRRTAMLCAAVLLTALVGVSCGGDSSSTGGPSGRLVSELITDGEGELVTISGEVISADGPAEAVRVRFTAPSAEADDWTVGGRTDAAGLFAFELEPGDYQLRFDSDDTALARTFYPDRASREEAGTLTLTAGQKVVLIVQLEAAAE